MSVPEKGLTVRDLRVEVRDDGRRLAPVDGVDFQVAPGECVVLLGESGCGKSLTALALMRLLPDGLQLAGGQARLGTEDLFALTEQAMREVRGGRLSMIFQEPMLSLNPVLSVGQQIQEALDVHRRLNQAEGAVEVERLLHAVGLEARHGAGYPFQLSGGQRQRALIATMLAGEPELLIADEPTTALDVTVQAQILRLLKRLQSERGMGLLLITHDLDVARDMADRVVVMYAGQVVESASRQALYERPMHPYTRKLFSVLPSAHQRHERLEHIAGSVPPLGTAFSGCRFADRCPWSWARCRDEAPALAEHASGHWARCHLLDDSVPGSEQMKAKPRADAMAPEAAPVREADALLEVSDLAVHFPIRKGLLRRTVGLVKAVDGVCLRVRQGETLALVGESGCGKTTLARAVLQLIAPTAGQIRLQGEVLDGLSGAALRDLRARMQIVFQDPFSSLNPRMRVGEILQEGMQSLRPALSRQQRGEVVADLLQQVGLNADAALRYPHAFSGGQRQRIAIARALAVQPRLLICDEPTSALDVSVQAQILSLLQDLQASQGLGYLFITHNLPVVGYLAHRVAVMYRGRIVEEGATEGLMRQPAHPYTKLLLDSAPGQGLKGEDAAATGGVASAMGCSFAPRCPKAMDVCRQDVPREVVLEDGRRVTCHLFRDAGPH